MRKPDERVPGEWALLVLTSALAAVLLVRIEHRLPEEALRPLPVTVAGTATGTPSRVAA